MSDLIWVRSSYSGSQGGQCVEVAAAPTGIAIRDSKDPDGPMLRFTVEAWKDFLGRVKSER
jgi:hypothetical protein